MLAPPQTGGHHSRSNTRRRRRRPRRAAARQSGDRPRHRSGARLRDDPDDRDGSADPCGRPLCLPVRQTAHRRAAVDRRAEFAATTSDANSAAPRRRSAVSHQYGTGRLTVDIRSSDRAGPVGRGAALGGCGGPGRGRDRDHGLLVPTADHRRSEHHPHCRCSRVHHAPKAIRCDVVCSAGGGQRRTTRRGDRDGRTRRQGLRSGITRGRRTRRPGRRPVLETTARGEDQRAIRADDGSHPPGWEWSR